MTFSFLTMSGQSGKTERSSKMRKVVIALALLALLAGHVYAGTMETTIISQQLDDNPIQKFSDNIYVGDCSRVGFFVVYDETEVGNSISALIDVTYNPTSTVGTPASGYFYDFAGGSTLQTAETITADGEYFFWMPDTPIQYVQVRVKGINTDTDDILNITVYMITER